MPFRKPYAELYVHLVWATWDRLPLITPEVQQAVYACIHTECETLRAELLEIGGIEDHVHLLARIPPTLCIAELAKQVKGSSSHLVTHRLPGSHDFKWQGAYGAFTVSRSHVPGVRRYIRNQEAHHRNQILNEHLEAIFEPDRPSELGESAEADFV